ncbi:MAG: 4-hydroxy-3-methylbut-2-enyl diphosphate reductase [Bacteroidetes bacterium]|nr:MAG: 4-hydroxy-3-methylbut-2-enyl diphosphate reductase [Bacteroidota bacterium]
MPKYQSRNFKKQYDLGQYAPLYRNSILSHLKNSRPPADRMAPFRLDFGPVSFGVARHFGFCKGVENAIEVAYETLTRYPDRRVFMISELIHNSFVNADLQARGLRFLKTAKGQQLIPWTELRPDDVVITPAFGATLEDQAALRAQGVDLQQWNATCRFVENVWFRARELGEQGYTIIVHGKFRHEETLATLSHSRQHAPTIVVKDMAEAQQLGEMMLGQRPMDDFAEIFAGKHSHGFDPEKDLERVAVVNQTTMLATETADISDYFRTVMIERFGEADIDHHVANTRDTLCYATKNNQSATQRLLEEPADLAIVIGGRNSSNTSHLVELCEQKLPTFFIASERDILSRYELLHYDFRQHKEQVVRNYLPSDRPVRILLTSGASCPDAIVERVLTRLLEFFDLTRKPEEVIRSSIVLAS